MAAVGSAKTVQTPQQQWNAQQITVVAVIDTQTGDQLQDRQVALEEIEQAVHGVGANFQRVPVKIQLIIYCYIIRFFLYFSLISWISEKLKNWKCFIMRM